jgi:hypothetical protein
MGNLLANPTYKLLITNMHSWLPFVVRPCAKNASKRLMRNRHRNRVHALNEVLALSDSMFSKMFRMDRRGFENLLIKITPFVFEPNCDMATRSSGSSITIRTKLYCTLRWLAGGSYLDICFAWGVAESSFYSDEDGRGIIWPIIRAIDIAFNIGMPINDPEKLKNMADGFAHYSNGELYGCASAIDGWVARTRKPYRTEVNDIMSYRNRHECWGLVVLAGCDANCIFTMFSCKSAGSTNDSIAWQLSELRRLIEEDKLLPNEYFIIGDEAFQCSEQLLVPYGGRGLGIWKDSFNYHLSVQRQCIERAFALLVNRWGILWRPLRFSYDKWTLLLSVLAKLHNYCIENHIPLMRERLATDMESEDEAILNECNTILM